MNAINPGRIRKALQSLKDAEKEIEAALADAARLPPDPPAQPVIVIRLGGARRRVK